MVESSKTKEKTKGLGTVSGVLSYILFTICLPYQIFLMLLILNAYHIKYFC